MLPAKQKTDKRINISLEFKIMNKLFCSLLIAICLAWLTTGCASIQPGITTQSPMVDMKGLKKFYVARDDEAGVQDEKHLKTLRAVQEALTGHGFPATSGLQSAMPADTDCKVIIHDKWFWDLEWYLLYLDIKFYDARSGKLLASGHDCRSAPVTRRDLDFMANELIEAVFPASVGGTKPKPHNTTKKTRINHEFSLYYPVRSKHCLLGGLPRL